MHEPLQYACPAGHVHVLFMQVEPPPQTLPQAPQFALSFVKSTHAPFGHIVGVAAMHILPHVPPLQTHAVAPAGMGLDAQLFPHEPQLARSDCKLTHCPLHSVWPIGHPQAPFVHCCPPVHAVAQEPQCIESVCRLTHALLQFVSIGPKSVAHVSTQVPFKQLGVAAGQTVPQLPQFVGSVFVFTHALPHAASGEQFLPLSVIASVIGGPSIAPSPRTVTSFATASISAPSGRTLAPSRRTRAPSDSAVTPSDVTSNSASASPKSSSGSVRPHPSTIAASIHVPKHTYKKRRRPNLFMTPHPPIRRACAVYHQLSSRGEGPEGVRRKTPIAHWVGELPLETDTVTFTHTLANPRS